MQPKENPNIVPETNPNNVTVGQEPPATPTTGTNVGSTQASPPSPTKSHKKTIVALAVVIVIILIGGGVFAFYRNSHKTKAPVSVNKASSVTKPSAVSTPNNGLLTYVSNDSSNLITTDKNQKVLAKITNPAGNNGFNVLSNNGQEALVAAQTSSGNNEPEYLVDYKGTVTKLPTSVSSPNVSGTAGNGQFIGFSNNYVENSCTSDSQGDTLTCNVDNVDLKTGAVNVVASFSNSTANPSENPPTAILGVSSSGIVYVLYDSSDDTTSTHQSIKEISLNNGQTVKTVNVPGGATNGAWIYYALSNDFNTFANVNGVGDKQIQITNLNNGSVSTISDQCSGITNNLFWSSDNSKLAYDCNNGTGATVAYITASTGKVTQLKSIPNGNTDSKYGSLAGNSLNVEGWSSNSTINYYFSPNAGSNTPSSWQFYSADTTSGAVTPNPAPTGYGLAIGLGI